MQTIVNARIVSAADELAGRVVIDGKYISEVREGSSSEGAAPTHDAEGDFLIPGLVDLHTDNLEHHLAPRSGITWNAKLAVLAHDAEVVGAGITTVFDSLSLVGIKRGVDRAELLEPSLSALAWATDHSILKSDHFVHLRCEVTEGDIVARLKRWVRNPLVKLVSIMNHSPGQGQFVDPKMWFERNQAASGLDAAQLIELRKRQEASNESMAAANAVAISDLALSLGLTIATHDDHDENKVRSSQGWGATVSEFPTTLEAARAAKLARMDVLMGAPNVVRGGSHVGNLNAIECARSGLLDILASDYVPRSMLYAAFQLYTSGELRSLPEVVRLVSTAPARVVGLRDRGEIAVGMLADLVQVRLVENVPAIRAVWKSGVRVH